MAEPETLSSAAEQAAHAPSTSATADPNEAAEPGADEEEDVVDPDIQCAVKHLLGRKTLRCPHALGCRVHSRAQKEAVEDRSDQYDNLLVAQREGRQHSRKYTFNFRRRRVRHAGRIIDPDIHCSVPRANGSLCPNVLTCNDHVEDDKRKVEGRSGPYDEILYKYRVNTTSVAGSATANPDTQCAVALPNGLRCACMISCIIHSDSEKRQVTDRTYNYYILLDYHHKHKSLVYERIRGFGLAAAAAREDDKTTPMRRCYRRGITLAQRPHINKDDEVSDPTYVMLSPSGENLARLRQILYGGHSDNSYSSLLQVLPQAKFRNLSVAEVRKSKNGDKWSFWFVSQELGDAHTPRSPVSFQDVQAGRVRNAVVIETPETFFRLTSVEQEDATLKQLRSMLERYPLELHTMDYSMKMIFLHYSITSALGGERLQYAVRQAYVDGKPSLVVELSYFDKEAWTAKKLTIALPILQEPANVHIPQSKPFFKLHGNTFGEPWLGQMIPPDRQRKLYELAAYVASLFHMKATSQQQIQVSVVSVSRSYNVPILVRPDGEQQAFQPHIHQRLASFDEGSLKVIATEEAKKIASWLPDIEVKSVDSGRLVVECINNHFLHTQDLWLAWADGANAVDTHVRFSERLLNVRCSHSIEEAKWETHSCSGCGATTVCCSLETVVKEGTRARMCPHCRPPPEPEPDHSTSEFFQFSREKAHSEITRVTGLMKSAVRIERNKVFPDEIDPDNRPPEREEELEEVARMVDQYFSDSGPKGGLQSSDVYLTSPITKVDSRLQCSNEALSPLVFVEGTPRYHHPSNMGLTRLYANQLCGSFSPVALQILHTLDSTKDNAVIRDNIERADHLHLIRSQIPWKRISRLKATYTDEFKKTFVEECRTGITTEAGCARISQQDDKSHPYLWRMGVESMAVERDDQLPDFDAVRQFIVDMEASTGRIVKRVNNVPYPFAGGPIPRNWSWKRLYGLIATHFRILKRWCNSRFITTFTLPRLICTVIRLIHGGQAFQRSQLLDVPVSLWMRHLLHLSVGKDDHSQPMSTGLAEDVAIAFDNFDISAVNLCVEPWLCNASIGNRDFERDAVRKDFRTSLKKDNPPHWTASCAPIDAAVSARYIRNASIAVGDFALEHEDEGFELASDPPHEHVPGAGTPNQPVIHNRRNMFNLGQTCYMSTVLQNLLENPDVCDILTDDSKFHYAEYTGQAYLDFLPHYETTDNLSEAEITEFRNIRRSSQRLLVKSLRDLLAKLKEGGARLPREVTKLILTRVQLIDSRWDNAANESAQLLGELLDTLISASDKSVIAASPSIAQLAQTQTDDNKADVPLIELKDDAARYWSTFISEGHDSDLTELMFSQIAREVTCGDDDCSVISRNFEMTHIVYLDFPENTNARANFTLSQLLTSWDFTTVAQEYGHECEREKTHAKGTHSYRCFTRLAKYVCFAIRRGGSGTQHVLNHVYVPDDIDLSEHAQVNQMPSHLRQATEQEPPSREPIVYDLVSVNHWIASHYIAYQRVGIEGVQPVTSEQAQQDTSEVAEAGDQSRSGPTAWVMFNDSLEHVSSEAPSEGVARGELIHYAIYKRREGSTTPQREIQKEATTQQGATSHEEVRVGQDDDFPMIEAGDDTTIEPQTAPTIVGERAKAIRERPQSSDADIHDRRVVHPRGSYTSDVAAARQEPNFEAREAALQLSEAALARAQTTQQQKEDDLAKRIQDLELREQKVKDLEQRTRDLEDWKAHAKSLKQTYLDDIERLRSGFAAVETTHQAKIREVESRRADVISSIEKAETERARIVSQIEELQGTLANAEKEKEEILRALSDERTKIEAEIARLQALIVALLE